MAIRRGKLRIEVVRSNRKTLGLKIDQDGNVTAQAPYRMPMQEITDFVDEKMGWIEKHLAVIEEKKRERELHPAELLSDEDIDRLIQEALDYIPGRVKYYAAKMHVDYRSITIRNQRTRWGSCSTKGGLNFNCLLMLTPKEIIDYVVVHELCHRLEMNHSPRFWSEVEKVMPDYAERRAWLKENGEEIMRRMTG